MSLHKKPTKSKSKKSPAVTEENIPAEEPKKGRGCKKLITRWIIRGAIFVIIFLIVVPLLIYLSQPSYYKVLVIGSDQRGSEHARSDVLMVVAVPKKSDNQFSMVMVPRDTMIEHPDKGLQKITHFYAMWENEDEYLGNKELTTAVVEDLLDIKVNGTVEVTFDSFIEIVDMLGGVDTESQGHLDGAAAKELVHNRYNKEGGDFGRADAQREILRNLMSRVKDPVKARMVYDYFLKTDRARLDINRNGFMIFGLAYLIGHQGNISLGEVEEIVLPGAGQRIYTPDFGKELYYWVLDEEGVKELVEQYLK